MGTTILLAVDPSDTLTDLPGNTIGRLEANVPIVAAAEIDCRLDDVSDSANIPPKIDEANPASIGETFGPGNPVERDAESPVSPIVDDTVATDPVIESACAERFSEITRPKSGCCPIAADDMAPISPVVLDMIDRAPTIVAATVPVICTATIPDDAVAPANEVADCPMIGVLSVALTVPIVAALAPGEIDVAWAMLTEPSDVAAESPLRRLDPACDAVMEPREVAAEVPAIPIACAELNAPEDVATEAPCIAFAVEMTPTLAAATAPASETVTAGDASPADIAPLRPAIDPVLADKICPAEETASGTDGTTE